MKIHNLISIGLLVIMLGTTSCTDWLDVKPESELILDKYWQTESQAQEVVIACYRKLSETNNIRRMMVWGELRSDNLMATYPTMADAEMTSGLSKILDVDINPNNIYCYWGSIYNVINYCNTVLNYAPGVMERDANFTLNDLHAMQAEVLTLRSLCYFYLVRTFKNVPWVSTASIDDTQDYNVAQSSERVVLDNIIADLKDAATYARADYGNNTYNKGRITRNAVLALLADVYLWDQNYEKCVEACNQMLLDANLKLESSDNMFYNVFYKGNSSESIFELQFDDAGVVNKACTTWYGTSSRTTGDLCLPPFLAKGEMSPFNHKLSSGAVESKDDIRFNEFFRPASSTGVYSIFKYAGIIRQEVTINSQTVPTYFYRSSTPNWIVYRLSDVMLMKAEALAQLNRSESDRLEVVNIVNQTYMRSNPSGDSLTVNNYPNVSDLQSLVLRERQRELLFEGKRWFDLMRLARRTNSTTEILGYISPKFSGEGDIYSKMSIMDGLYMPIAQSELEANPTLKQNPYYDNLSNANSK